MFEMQKIVECNILNIAYRGVTESFPKVIKTA